MAHEVFISHSSLDKPVADAVCAALENAAIRCWIAPRDVHPGLSFAGYSTLQANDQRVHAFLHNGKGMIDLGSLGAKGTDTDVSVALGVNKLDQVVGYSYLPGQLIMQQVAFLWRPNAGGGQMINLNKLLDATGKNYLLISATAINDNGQIVANAWDTQNGGPRAVLLTPIGAVN